MAANWRGTTSGRFVQIFDVVFEDEEIGSVFACDADEAMVEIFDDPANDFIVAQFYADTRFYFDQMFEVFDLFESLFRGTRAAR